MIVSGNFKALFCVISVLIHWYPWQLSNTSFMTVSEKLGGKKKQNKINVRKQKNMQTKHDYGENAET